MQGNIEVGVHGLVAMIGDHGEQRVVVATQLLEASGDGPHRLINAPIGRRRLRPKGIDVVAAPVDARQHDESEGRRVTERRDRQARRRTIRTS